LRLITMAACVGATFQFGAMFGNGPDVQPAWQPAQAAIGLQIVRTFRHHTCPGPRRTMSVWETTFLVTRDRK